MILAGRAGSGRPEPASLMERDAFALREQTRRLDADIAAWFKSHTPSDEGYQARINRALGEYAQGKASRSRHSRVRGRGRATSAYPRCSEDSATFGWPAPRISDSIPDSTRFPTSFLEHRRTATCCPVGSHIK
ncbi:MAG: BrnA antitoxin family protein [Alphaproteobacteria bacterium]|nr:BrnA antitoxin family protein [Alphaproteobacteria bacterium]MCW5741345.1 BrnA antitoxin family protein [Alphaproteobacteria bacterium]